ncbi:hypothetical protein WT88_18100 [Burkholderia stagnalis]|nr:hypothetical protein WT35_20760 [Burkholderia stagnalis]KWA56361.1 hypothetical protein WT42_10415 [Burkholderia stagnalis]KWD01924.1 hypothetical protein WT45_10940 [Burkholderia stagnalis]KWD05310.1 hypothetical protein WT46_12950 [Burkholderia stagnalis]KWH75092.1 hypothetical protein WT65_14830 [Burkholderia stagnalis]
MAGLVSAGTTPVACARPPGTPSAARVVAGSGAACSAADAAASDKVAASRVSLNGVRAGPRVRRPASSIMYVSPNRVVAPRAMRGVVE